MNKRIKKKYKPIKELWDCLEWFLFRLNRHAARLDGLDNRLDNLESEIKLAEQADKISELSQEIMELREVVEQNALATNRELERVKSGKKRGFEKFFRKG